MDQATQTATPTAATASFNAEMLTSEHAAYQRASALLDRIVGKLTILPRLAAVVGDLDGFRIRLNFGTNDPRGVLEFAALADVEASRDHSAGGVWFEARSTIEDIPACAEVLLSDEAAAVFEQQSPAPHPEPEPDDAVPAAPEAARPVALGASILAQAPAVTPVVPLDAEQLDADPLADDETPRCVRCGCTDDAACEGGCYWVPNAQMHDLCSACATTEELQAMTYTAEIPDGGE